MLDLRDLQIAASECYSWSALYKKVYNKKEVSGRALTKFKKDYEGTIDTTHFTRHGRPSTTVTKECPVCGNKFKTSTLSKTKTTCSHACANTYFRSKIDHPNWSDDFYRSTCFFYHKRECVICGEDKVVEVHHLDENRKKNDPRNFVPLCPTHHRYWHSRYKPEIEDKVMYYVKQFIDSYGV